MQVDDILTQGVILRLQLLIRLLHVTKVADLLLELLDIFFLALAERTLGGSVLRCALGLRKLPLGSIAFCARVLVWHS